MLLSCAVDSCYYLMLARSRSDHLQLEDMQAESFDVSAGPQNAAEQKAEDTGRAEVAEGQASNYKRQALSFEDKANMHQVESQRAHNSLLIAQDTIQALQRESAGKSSTILELQGPARAGGHF